MLILLATTVRNAVHIDLLHQFSCMQHEDGQTSSQELSLCLGYVKDLVALTHLQLALNLGHGSGRIPNIYGQIG
eukprot:790872-Pleurochrysis_carterae.AAC.2